MTTKTWTAKTEDDTATIARTIADMLPPRAVVCLSGPMGSGKTSFCRALIRHVLKNPDEVVPSPTYSLVQTYDDGAIWHFDLYRLDHPEDIYDVGWEEALTAPLCLIEWPEMAGDLLPRQSINITLEATDDTSRVITLNL